MPYQVSCELFVQLNVRENECVVAIGLLVIVQTD